MLSIFNRSLQNIPLSDVSFLSPTLLLPTPEYVISIAVNMNISICLRHWTLSCFFFSYAGYVYVYHHNTGLFHSWQIASINPINIGSQWELP